MIPSDILKKIKRIPGWMQDDELNWLYTKAQECRGSGIWVEIGSWMGKSLACVAYGLPSSWTIVGIDPFEIYKDVKESKTGKALREIRDGSARTKLRKTLVRLRKDRPDLNIIYMDCRSTTAVLLSFPVDVCFIDGCHQYEDVKKDIETWWPLVRNGGMICGHDYTVEHPGVQRAVNEFGGIEVAGSIWWKVKKEDK